MLQGCVRSRFHRERDLRPGDRTPEGVEIVGFRAYFDYVRDIASIASPSEKGIVEMHGSETA